MSVEKSKTLDAGIEKRPDIAPFGAREKTTRIETKADSPEKKRV